jgi:hypothetical protein
VIIVILVSASVFDGSVSAKINLWSMTQSAYSVV